MLLLQDRRPLWAYPIRIGIVAFWMFVFHVPIK